MKNHTKAFMQQIKGVLEPSFAQAEHFVMRLSEQTSEQVVAKIVSRTRKTYVTNKEIYMYCKENGIEADHDPSQTEIVFEEKKRIVDYEPMDDITIDGNEAVVMKNNKDNKTVTVQFMYDQEIEVIHYKNIKL
jgi:hypothetical protein